MKKITLITLLMFFTVFAFSQDLLNHRKEITNIQKNNNVTTNKNYSVKSTYAALDTIWSSDFSDTTQWTISNGAGNNDNWVIGTTGPSGGYAIPAIMSTTASNGFALFDSDVMCSGNQDGYLTNANAIDCSTRPTVIISFESYYRKFTDEIYVQVSNDGTNWTDFQVHAGYSANQSDATNPTTESINITSVAGGQATVYIRFEFRSLSANSQDGCDYAWMVDDVYLTEAPAHDIVLKNQYVDFLYSGTPVYYQFPLPQVYGGNGIFFEAEAQNMGATTETPSYKVKVTRTDNDSVVFNETSNLATNVAVAELDTLVWDITGSDMAFFPTQKGDYRVRQELAITGDAIPSNNVDSSVTFTITDTTLALYQTVDGTIDVGDYRTPAGDSQDGDCIGNMFLLSTADTISSIDVFVNGGTGGTAVGAELYGYIWDYENGKSIVLETMLPHVVTSSDINQFVTLSFDKTDLSSLVLQADHLYIYGFSSSNGNVRIGGDLSSHQAPGSTWIFIAGDQWWWVTRTGVLNLNLYRKKTTAINSHKAVNFTVSQNYPNPAKDNTTITYRLTETNNVSLDVFDNLGKKVITLDQGEKTPGKYNINLNTNKLSAGIYTYKLNVGNKSVSKKMNIIK